MSAAEVIIRLFESRGDSQYGGEAVTQLEHALQSAALAEREQAPAELIVAALLHDIGHLLHNLPDYAPDEGIDDHHETNAGHYLRKHFPDSVTEPVRLHVAAKRYLCAVDPTYMQHLSEPSIASLELQGGPMSSVEVAEFLQQPFSQDAVRLRRWDDEGKVPELKTTPISYFAKYFQEVQLKAGNG